MVTLLTSNQRKKIIEKVNLEKKHVLTDNSLEPLTDIPKRVAIFHTAST